MAITVEIESIALIQCNTRDEVFLQTRKPNPFKTEGPMQMMFCVPAGEGWRYVIDHFGVEPTRIVDTRILPDF